MTTEVDEAIHTLLSNRTLFIETLLQIEDKERDLVQFKLNPIQKDIIGTATGRDIYVKPAQVGFSSVSIADYLVDALTIRGTVAVIVSYNDFISGRLLRKAQLFYDILKSRVPSIPDLHHRSTSEKTFPDMHSSFYIGSAGSFAFGRGETIHDLLLDEYAFWQPGDAQRIALPTIQRVPLSGRVRIGSTPNGEDNDFCEMYKAAKEGKDIGKSVFTAHFYPWTQHPEYQLDKDSPYALPADNISPLQYSEDELKLVNNYNTTEEQIRWRRRKIAEVESMRRSGETRLLFSQEYPENDIDCFLAAGDMVYDIDNVNRLAKECYPAPYSFQSAQVWYPPQQGKRYLIGIDPGLGKESKSVATVWHFADDKFTHCATLGGLYVPDIMAGKVIELGGYYNKALLAAESNIEFVTHIKNYPNLYYRQDILSGKVSNHIGWQTSRGNKQYMITELNRNLTKIITHDNIFVSQLRNLRYYGEKIISIGSDDYHDSAAIAIVCRDSMPITRGVVGSCGWKW